MKLRCLTTLSGALAMLAVTRPAHSQTDYYNTDSGRPLQIEEGFPFTFIDETEGRTTAGLAGIDISMLHNLNAETVIPAFALGASVALPIGSLAAEEAHVSIKAVMTRTFTWARFHINGQYTMGEAPPAPAAVPEGPVDEHGDGELSRWLGGIAVDRALPLRSMLLGAEVYAQEPLRVDEPVEWNAGIGTRYQVSPRIAIDAGIGRGLTGESQTWHATFGAALAVGLPWYP